MTTTAKTKDAYARQSAKHRQRVEERAREAGYASLEALLRDERLTLVEMGAALGLRSSAGAHHWQKRLGIRGTRISGRQRFELAPWRPVATSQPCRLCGEPAIDFELCRVHLMNITVQCSRWRLGARDQFARRGHNLDLRRRRRDRITEQVRPKWEHLLNAIRNEADPVQAAALRGLSWQTVTSYAGMHVSRRRALDAALMAGRNPAISHGTDHSYKAHKCRCPECREAHDRVR